MTQYSTEVKVQTEKFNSNCEEMKLSTLKKKHVGKTFLQFIFHQYLEVGHHQCIMVENEQLQDERRDNNNNKIIINQSQISNNDNSQQ